MFAGLDKISTACETAGITMTQATYSWMLNHAGLGEADGVLLGASRLEHLEQNLACCKAAEQLPAGVLSAFDEAWALCKPDAFAFWRGYSGDQPGKESMDPGASYAVKK